MNKEEVPPLQEPEIVYYNYFPYDIALIIDNVVYQTMNVPGEVAAQYMSQPKFVQYTNNAAHVGWTYDEETDTFLQPPIQNDDPEFDPTLSPNI
jgi:hypothetical protein